MVVDDTLPAQVPDEDGQIGANMEAFGLLDDFGKNDAGDLEWDDDPDNKWPKSKGWNKIPGGWVSDSGKQLWYEDKGLIKRCPICRDHIMPCEADFDFLTRFSRREIMYAKMYFRDAEVRKSAKRLRRSAISKTFAKDLRRAKFKYARRTLAGEARYWRKRAEKKRARATAQAAGRANQLARDENVSAEDQAAVAQTHWSVALLLRVADREEARAAHNMPAVGQTAPDMTVLDGGEWRAIKSGKAEMVGGARNPIVLE
ncbi:hypothetical protein LTR37_001602 [Vermiconidia calcicola]|uniref:Uncharacterized protein n=1 Tax=Vermiconidia calcicola TaxID=1690605 RepID=A0ACC3NVP2_9PEZI|nr:hypothetical protein LTR37_001602 [Vermiconidia calcicola]